MVPGLATEVKQHPTTWTRIIRSCWLVAVPAVPYLYAAGIFGPLLTTTIIALVMLLAPPLYGVLSLGLIGLLIPFSGIFFNLPPPLPAAPELWFAIMEAVLAVLFFVRRRLVAAPVIAFGRTRRGATIIGWLRTVVFVGALFEGVLLLFRDADAYHAAVGLVLLVLLWRALPHKNVPFRQAIREGAVNGVVLCVSILIALALVEAGARLLIPGALEGGQIFEPNDEYLFQLKPGGSEVHYFRTGLKTTGSIHIRISPQGFRDRVFGPKAEKEFRILMLGDSFTMGYAVEAKDTFPKQLERMLAKAGLPGPVSVVNGGMAGAGEWQEEGVLRDRGFALEPDLVILQIFHTNDIENCLEVVNKQYRAFDQEWQTELRVYRQWHTPPMRYEMWARNHLRSYEQFRAIFGHDTWIASCIRNLRFTQDHWLPYLPPSEGGRPFWIECDLADWYPELDQGMDLMKKYIAKIQQDCADRNVDFAAFDMPDINDVSPKWWKVSKGYATDGSKYEFRKALHKTVAFLNGQHIPTIDLTDVLSAAPDIDALYYPYDGHLTAKGNAVVAKQIERYLLETYDLRGVMQRKIAEHAATRHPALPLRAR